MHMNEYYSSICSCVASQLRQKKALAESAEHEIVDFLGILDPKSFELFERLKRARFDGSNFATVQTQLAKLGQAVEQALVDAGQVVARQAELDELAERSECAVLNVLDV